MDEVVFLFIGGPHHVFHLAPVAAELSRLAPGLRVTCLHADAGSGRLIAQVRDALDAPALRIEPAPVPWLGRALTRLTGRAGAAKGPLLLSLVRRTRHTRALVTPERTSALLRWLLPRAVRLAHFRHGAGDRAPASEKRLALFDLVAVPGQKDRARAVRDLGVPSERVVDVGYVKLELLRRLPAPPVRAGGRPLVLYNPHFDAAVSSIGRAAEVVAAFAAQDRYDLVVAPHLRAGRDMDAATRARWRAMAVPERITIDLDSDRLVDMGWTRAADVWLGDVSSQLYEFLARPRPVAFLDAHGVDWAGDPRYAGWALGEVTRDPADTPAAVARAIAGHGEVAEAQRAAVARAFGDPEGAARRGAQAVLDLIAPENRPIAGA